MIWPHTVTAYPAETVADSDGNPIRRPTSAGVVVAAFVQPVRSTEDTGDGQASEVQAMAWLEQSAPELDAFCRLDFNGVTFETVGAALWFADPDGSVRFWRVNLRNVG